jgi:hypothetical protein
VADFLARTITAEDRETYRLRSKYGIDLRQKEALFQFQGKKCAICETSDPATVWAIDHCHKTERETGYIKVRAILCSNCNSMLGFAKENTKTLMAAISYIEKHSK